MDDLNAASLEGVRTWCETWYGTANAVLVVAGDVDPEDVRARVERYFGHIPSGPPLIKPDVNLARRTEKSRIVLQDRVPQARVYKAWNVAAFKNPDLDHLDLASDVLTTGRTSRLYRRLVYDDQIATDVSAALDTADEGRPLAGLRPRQLGRGRARFEERAELLVQDRLHRGRVPSRLDRRLQDEQAAELSRASAASRTCWRPARSTSAAPTATSGRRKRS